MDDPHFEPFQISIGIGLDRFSQQASDEDDRAIIRDTENVGVNLRLPISFAKSYISSGWVDKNSKLTAVPREFKFDDPDKPLDIEDLRNALTAVTQWDDKCGNAIDYAEDVLSDDEDLFTLASMLIDTAEFIGRRIALRQLFCRDFITNQHEAVAIWGRLQQVFCEWWDEVLYGDGHEPVNFYIEGKTRVRDYDIFRLASPFIYQADIDWDEWAKAVDPISDGNGYSLNPTYVDSCAEVMDDWPTYRAKQLLHYRPFDQEWPNPIEGTCRVGWRMARRLPGRLRPVEPDLVVGHQHAVRELDRLILWCEQQQDLMPVAIPTAISQPKAPRKTLAEYNVIARVYLEKNPKPKIREIISAVGCGVKTLYKLPSFIVVREELSKGRKPKKPKKEVQLTGAMEAITPARTDGELARLVTEQRRDMKSERRSNRERC